MFSPSNKIKGGIFILFLEATEKGMIPRKAVI
jgi:hypothetical protein